MSGSAAFKPLPAASTALETHPNTRKAGEPAAIGTVSTQETFPSVTGY